MIPDVVCLGSGRSGTSFTAKVLSDHYGVCWGNRIDPRPQPERGMAEGRWEDQNMRQWNTYLAHTKISPQEWLDQFEKAHTKCRKEKKLHGVKDPYLLLADPWSIAKLNPRLLIICHRSFEQVLASRKKHTALHRENWLEYWSYHTHLCHHKETTLASSWKDKFVWLDFTERRPASYVIDSIGDLL